MTARRLQWSDRRPVLIEIKFFSLPDENQLEAYAGRLADNGLAASYWLLSLSDPGWPDDRKKICSHEWRRLSYRKLAGSIRSALPSQERSYAVETMRHYADVAELLSDLVAQVTVSGSDDAGELLDEVKSAIGEGRLVSAMMKLRARSVAQHVNGFLADDAHATGRSASLQSGLSI